MSEAVSQSLPLSQEKLAKLVTVGRTSGIPHVAVVRFVQRDGTFLVLGGKAHSDWVLNSLASGNLKLRLGEYSYEMAVSTEKDKRAILELYTTKYGRELTDSWYANSEACLKLTPLGPPTRRGGVKGEGSVTIDFATWKTKNDDYYTGVAAAFDSASDEYDHTIRNNFINGWIRKRSIDQLLKLVNRDDVLLEIGCGTGAEALKISRHVAGIVATDISPSMIDLLRRKVEARGVRKLVPLLLAASDIASAREVLPEGKTRIAYSFNGALNCEPRLERFAGELSKVLDDDGFFLCSIRNSFCLSEALAHGAVLQFQKMAPRKKQPVMVSVGGMDIPSYYYNPKKFAGFFSHHFKVVKMVGLPTFLPPAYLSDLYFRARGVLSFAERIETTAAASFPFNLVGDQTLILFRRK